KIDEPRPGTDWTFPGPPRSRYTDHRRKPPPPSPLSASERGLGGGVTASVRRPVRSEHEHPREPERGRPAEPGTGPPPVRPGPAVRLVPKLPRHRRPRAGRELAAGQGGRVGPDPADAAGGLPRLRALPRDDRGGVAGVAAAHPGPQRGQLRAAVPRD